VAESHETLATSEFLAQNPFRPLRAADLEYQV
jgi:hypothetical protein